MPIPIFIRFFIASLFCATAAFAQTQAEGDDTPDFFDARDLLPLERLDAINADHGRLLLPPVTIEFETLKLLQADKQRLFEIFDTIKRARATRYAVIFEVSDQMDSAMYNAALPDILDTVNQIFTHSQPQIFFENADFTDPDSDQFGLRIEQIGAVERTKFQADRRASDQEFWLNQYASAGVGDDVYIMLEFEPGTATFTADSRAFLDRFVLPYQLRHPWAHRIFINKQTIWGSGNPEAEQLEQARLEEAYAWLAPRGDVPLELPDFTAMPHAPLSPLMEIGLRLEQDVPFEPSQWDFAPFAPADVEAVHLSPDLPAPSFQLTDPRLEDNFRGAIDFWVEPAWQTPQGFDPTMLTLKDGLMTRISVHMMEDRTGLAVFNGVRGPAGYLALDYDFSDNRAYHIALSTVGSRTTVFVDGKPLSPDLPLEYGSAQARQLVIGDDALGESPFTGRIGSPRIWHTELNTLEVRKLRKMTSGFPEDTDPLQDRLSHAVFRNSETGAHERRELDPWTIPAEGWWAPIDEADIRLVNPGDFLDGKAPPQFSMVQKAWAAQQIGQTAESDAVFDPHFTLRRAVHISYDNGLSLSDYRLPRDLRSPSGETIDWKEFGASWGLRISKGPGGVTSMVSMICTTTTTTSEYGKICADSLPEGDVALVFDDDEVIRGLGWDRFEDGLRNLFFITNKRTVVNLGNSGAPLARVQKRYRVFLPAGLQADAITVYYDGTSDRRVVSVGLDFDQRNALPGLTMVSETGAAVRYARKYPSRFEPLQDGSGLIESLLGQKPSTAELYMRGDQRLHIGFGTTELMFLPNLTAEPPNDTYNNTFVSLSKAVNLRSSFSGYHLTRMDPLHLIRTGTRAPVFKEPDGSSHDYYDANRIFVPLGLHYVPEFTGRNHSKVTTADTYTEYLDSFSDTVSAGISSKVIPGSFKESVTMSRARQSISENKMSKTRGLSRAIFYDLVLDKQHIELSDRFRDAAIDLTKDDNFEAFVDVFGTHYPVAVIYGGLGVLEIDSTEQMHQTMTRDGIDIKLEASVMLDAETNTNASFGYEHKEEHQKTFRSVLGSQTENFYWIGGTHAGVEHSSWSVGTDGVVPVHVSLRPLYELLSPVFFDDPKVYVLARASLKSVINRKIADANANTPRDRDKDLYALEIRIDEVQCNAGETDNFRIPDQRKVQGKDVAVRDRIASSLQFPIVIARAYDGDGFALRNLAEERSHADTKADKKKPARVFCPSYNNILEDIGPDADPTIFRFMFNARDLRNKDIRFDLLNRADWETGILFPRPTDKEVSTDAVVGFFTGALSLLGEELFTDSGSPLLNAAMPEVRPNGYGFVYSLRTQLCLLANICQPTNAARSTVPSNAALDTIAGRWFTNHKYFPPPEDCWLCEDRFVKFSLRVLK